MIKLTQSSIVLKGLHFHANHGVLEQERTVGNDYQVDLKLHSDLCEAMRSDDVNQTINYAEVFEVVKTVMKQPVNLIERVVYVIAERLFEMFPTLDKVEIKVAKINPPMGADGCQASVEATFYRK